MDLSWFECHHWQQVENLLSTTKFIDRKFHVTIHKALYSSRGVIRCRDLSDMTEEEICEELREQDVVTVCWVILKKGDTVTPTNTLFLTFKLDRTCQNYVHRLPAGQG